MSTRAVVSLLLRLVTRQVACLDDTPKSLGVVVNIKIADVFDLSGRESARPNGLAGKILPTLQADILLVHILCFWQYRLRTIVPRDITLGSLGMFA